MEKCPICREDMKLLTDKEKQESMPSHYEHYGITHDWYYCESHDTMVMDRIDKE